MLFAVSKQVYDSFYTKCPAFLMNLNKNPCGSIWQQSEKEGKMRKTNWKWKNSLIVQGAEG